MTRSWFHPSCPRLPQRLILGISMRSLQHRLLPLPHQRNLMKMAWTRLTMNEDLISHNSLIRPVDVSDWLQGILCVFPNGSTWLGRPRRTGKYVAMLGKVSPLFSFSVLAYRPGKNVLFVSFVCLILCEWVVFNFFWLSLVWLVGLKKGVCTVGRSTKIVKKMVTFSNICLQ